MKNIWHSKEKTKIKEKTIEKQKRKKPDIVLRSEDILVEQNDEFLDDLPQEATEDSLIKLSTQESEQIDLDDEEVFIDNDTYSDFDLEDLKTVQKSYVLKVGEINGERIFYLQMDNVKNLSDERLAKIEDYLFFIAENIVKKNEPLFSNPCNLIDKMKEIKKISSKHILDALIKANDNREYSSDDKLKLKNYISYLINHSFFDLNGNIIELKSFIEDYRTLKMKKSAERFVNKYLNQLLDKTDKEIRQFYKQVTKGKKLSDERLTHIKELLNDKRENSQ